MGSNFINQFIPPGNINVQRIINTLKGKAQIFLPVMHSIKSIKKVPDKLHICPKENNSYYYKNPFKNILSFRYWLYNETIIYRLRKQSRIPGPAILASKDRALYWNFKGFGGISWNNFYWTY